MTKLKVTILILAFAFTMGCRGITTESLGRGSTQTDNEIAHSNDKISQKTCDPGHIKIATADDLHLVKDDLAGNYCLTTSISLTGAHAIWIPIGTKDIPFTGIFDGFSNTISGLMVDDQSKDYQGFFAAIGKNAVVKNLVISDPVVKGKSYVGILAGKNEGTIESVTVRNEGRGSVNASVNTAGGLIGFNTGSIRNSHYKNGIVTGTSKLGGLVGHHKGADMQGSSASGTVTGTSSIGGLIGSNDNGSITNSEASGSISGNAEATGGLVGLNNAGSITSSHFKNGTVAGVSGVGGLVGQNAGADIEDSSASGMVTGVSSIGGLIGSNDSGSILNSKASGSVKGSTDTIGGLIGYNNKGSITYSEASGPVSGSSDSIGGLVGFNKAGNISSSHYRNGAITGVSKLGGLVGHHIDANIEYSSASGTVTGVSSIGGLIGYSERHNHAASISHSTASGDVTGTACCVGGLIGYNVGDTTQAIRITNSNYDSGTVTGGHYVGGLVGANGYPSTSGAPSDTYGYKQGQYGAHISESYVKGTVKGTGDGVGGLVGFNLSSLIHRYVITISASYVIGDVSGDSNVGGLLGEALRIVITNSYVRGNVTGTGAKIGGLVGHQNGSDLRNKLGVKRSYIAGKVEGNTLTGVLVGRHAYSVLEQSYYDKSIATGNPPSVGATSGGSTTDATGLSTSDITDESVFTDWDFHTVWKWLGPGKWPELAWQK